MYIARKNTVYYIVGLLTDFLSEHTHTHTNKHSMFLCYCGRKGERSNRREKKSRKRESIIVCSTCPTGSPGAFFMSISVWPEKEYLLECRFWYAPMNRVCLCVFLYAKFFFYVTIIQTIDTGRTNRTAIIDTAKHFHLPHILTLYLFENFVSLFFLFLKLLWFSFNCMKSIRPIL